MSTPFGEADTRAKLIDPALHARGWTEDLIRREETAGAIEVVDGRPRRRARGRIDYLLRIRVNSTSQPVAVALIEAKAESLPPTHGLEQGKAYAGPASASTCPWSMRPTATSSSSGPNVGAHRQPAAAHRVSDPRRPPRALRAGDGLRPGIAPGPAAAHALPRRRGYAPLLPGRRHPGRAREAGPGREAGASLAGHGSGEDVHRRAAPPEDRRGRSASRALFVCARDELRSQALTAFQNEFGADAAAVSGGNPQKNARILIATYETLDVDTDEAAASFLVTHYPEDYFSHSVIDECPRSAWGKWSQVLTRNPGAIQVGLTATPRQLEVSERSREAEADRQVNADNLRHFGEPVYEYDMGRGIEDGYLAACEIARRDIFLDDNPRNERETGVAQADLGGQGAARRLHRRGRGWAEARVRYEATAFEDRLLLSERVAAMTRDLFAHLLASGGPEQKTIVFCARDRHADDVASALNNLYATWCTAEGRVRREPYAFKCTAASGGQEYLADLRGASRHHFVATTVDLLTTGVDGPCVRNVVFFKYARLPIAFHQMAVAAPG